MWLGLGMRLEIRPDIRLRMELIAETGHWAENETRLWSRSGNVAKNKAGDGFEDGAGDAAGDRRLERVLRLGMGLRMWLGRRGRNWRETFNEIMIGQTI